MTDKRPDPPDRDEGAETLVRWTLAELRKIRASNAGWVADLEEQLEIARLCFHESVMAENALSRLVEGEMFVGGRVMRQDFNAAWLDAEIRPDALAIPHTPAPAIDPPPPPILAHLSRAWAALNIGHYAACAPTLRFGSSNRPTKINMPDPAPAALAKPGRKPKEDHSLLGNLERLWELGDVTFDALYAHMDHNKYGRRQFEKDLRDMGQTGGLLRIRFHGGESWIIPPIGKPTPPGSIFGADGNPGDPVTRVNQPIAPNPHATPNGKLVGDPSEGQPRPGMMSPEEVEAHNAKLIGRWKTKPHRGPTRPMSWVCNPEVREDP